VYFELDVVADAGPWVVGTVEKCDDTWLDDIGGAGVDEDFLVDDFFVDEGFLDEEDFFVDDDFLDVVYFLVDDFSFVDVEYFEDDGGGIGGNVALGGPQFATSQSAKV